MTRRLHTSIIGIIFLSLGLLAASAKSETTDYDHYVGSYAYETTPYWPEFLIVKDKNEWVLQLPDSKWKTELQRADGTLTVKEDDDTAIRLSYEPAEERYVMTSVAVGPSGTQKVREKRILVKLKPGPNDRLEKKYGVTALDIVRKVRAGEEWIHQVKSLRIKAKYQWTKTPRGIAYRKKELKEQWPDADLTRERFWALAPEQTGELDVAFDKRRFRTYDFKEEAGESLRIWDGQNYVAHEKYYTHDQEQYAFRRNFPELNHLLVDFMWPRSKHHDFWWNNQKTNNWEDSYGRAEEFILVGKQVYRGVSCYVIECLPKKLRRIRRWFVGMKDSLRYGDLIYEEGQLFREQWTGAYREITPGCWFPMRQGYHVLERGEDMNYFISGTRDIQVTEVKVGNALPDELLVMEFKDGIEVSDDRFGGFITYKYKKNRTAGEWEEIRRKAQERQESDSEEKRAMDSRIGQVALEFPPECKWIHTQSLTMKEFRGKAVVLQFWGIWCATCHNYMGMLKSKTIGEKIVVIGIHTPEEDLKKIEADLDKYKADGPVCVDTGQSWGRISEWYHVGVRPYWIVIGPDGKIVSHFSQASEALQAAGKSLPDAQEKE